MTAMAQVEILRAACCIAGSDENVDDGERKLLEKLADRVGVGQASLNAMILRAETEKSFYQSQFQVLKTDPKSTMGVLFKVAAEDGKVAPNQIEMLQHFAGRLGIDRDGFREIASPFLLD